MERSVAEVSLVLRLFTMTWTRSGVFYRQRLSKEGTWLLPWSTMTAPWCWLLASCLMSASRNQ